VGGVVTFNSLQLLVAIENGKASGSSKYPFSESRMRICFFSGVTVLGFSFSSFFFLLFYFRRIILIFLTERRGGGKKDGSERTEAK
jgi:hypothetical protein